MMINPRNCIFLCSWNVRFTSYSLNSVYSGRLIAFTVLVLVLAVFLDLRSAFWVAMGIPVTLLGTLFLLPLFGAYLDSIALAAMIRIDWS